MEEINPYIDEINTRYDNGESPAEIYASLNNRWHRLVLNEWRDKKTEDVQHFYAAMHEFHSALGRLYLQENGVTFDGLDSKFHFIKTDNSEKRN